MTSGRQLTDIVVTVDSDNYARHICLELSTWLGSDEPLEGNPTRAERQGAARYVAGVMARVLAGAELELINDTELQRCCVRPSGIYDDERCGTAGFDLLDAREPTAYITVPRKKRKAWLAWLDEALRHIAGEAAP